MDFIGPSRTVSKKSADPLVSRPKTRSVSSSPSKIVSKPKVKPSVSTSPKNKPVSAQNVPSAKSASISTAPGNDPIAKKASAALSGTDSSKSPFLKNYTIDKRPLSNSVREKSDSHFEKISFLGVSESSVERKHEKNFYEPEDSDKKEKKSKKDRKSSSAPIKIIDNSEKSSGFPLVIIILLTIILGAAFGAGIYFILPK